MPSLTFRHITNVHSQKLISAGLDPNNLYDQHLIEHNNVNALSQQWLQLSVNPPDRVFMNRRTGWVIDAIGGSLAPGAQLQQYPRHNGPNQRWAGQHGGTLNAEFEFPAGHPNSVWEPDHMSRSIFLRSRIAGNDSQLWIFDGIGVAETFKIKSVAFRLLLDVPGFTGADGSRIKLIPDNHGLNQVWSRESAAPGLSRFRSVCNDKMLEAQVALPEIVQRTADGTQNQSWIVNVVGHSSAGNEIVEIIPAVDTRKALDAPPGRMYVQQFQAHHMANQQWELVPVDFQP